MNDFTEMRFSNISSLGCDTNGKFAIIVHGFQENERTEWVRELINNLILLRGGCVMFFEYPPFTRFEYAFLLMDKFYRLSNILLKKLRELSSEGVDPDNIYMFGFSYGAQLVFDAGYKFGQRQIKEIDGNFE